MSFQKYAFLGEEIQSFIIDNSDDNECLKLSYMINELFNTEIEKLIHPIDDSKDVTIVALGIKALQTYNSIIILSKYGLESDSKALMRVLAENIFYIGALINDSRFYEEYYKKTGCQTMLIVKNIKNKKHSELFSEETISELNEIDFREIEEHSKTLIKEYKSTYNIAKKAGLLDIYVYVYGALSSHIHSDASIIKEYIDYVNDTFVGFNIMPSVKNQKYVLLTSNKLILKLLEFYNQYFTGGIGKRIDEIWIQNQSLYKLN